jgi:hypothetical protein
MGRLIASLAAFAALIACACADASKVSIEGDGNKPLRQRQFARLVSSRFEAIETAFGPLSGTLGTRVQLVFKRDNEHEPGELVYASAYDPQRNALVFSSRVLYQAFPSAEAAVLQYWPFYENEVLQSEFPIVGLIDAALWDAFLQESAISSGQTWPPADCRSPQVEKKLPCAMTVRAAFDYIRQLRQPLFNENRLDRILPENYTDFCTQSMRTTSREYQDVERYGGILLLKPLIVEFGIPRTLAYAARTPFSIQGNNMRTSVQKYQERARAALAW